MPPVTLAIAAASDALLPVARELAQRLALPLAPAACDMLLVVAPHLAAPGWRLQLEQTGPDAPGPVYADFVGGKAGHRRRAGEGRRQPIARAVGLKHGAMPTVLDATGGLGRDAFVLATLGCTVHIVERSPVIAALLGDGLARAALDPDATLVVARLALTCADARSYLRTLPDAQRPDVIYLDPMYPEREKSALVKKEMRIFRTLLGADTDAAELLDTALGCARLRVVVKRPKRAPPLASVAPHHCIESPNTRFDVYAIGRRRMDESAVAGIT